MACSAGMPKVEIQENPERNKNTQTMKTETKIANVDDVVIAMYVTGTIREWRTIRDALHSKNEYYGPVLTLMDKLRESFNAIEGQIKRTDFEIKDKP